MTSFRPGSDFCQYIQSAAAGVVPPRQQTAFPSRQDSWPAAVFWYFWNSSWARCQWPGVNVKRRGIRQLLEYSEDNFRARERSQGAQTHVASTGQRRLLNSKAIRNNSELLCVRSRRNMFWWMRLTMETASLSIPTRCLAETQWGAETMLGIMYQGWHVWHVYLASSAQLE